MEISKHKFMLSQAPIKRVCSGGSRIMATEALLPLLNTMALATIILEKNGVREPHWHPNAHELTYCLKGKALVTLFNGNFSDTFIFNEGEVMFIPQGYLHHIENIDEGISQFILCFNNGNPEDLGLSESIGSMTSHVLASTFSVTEDKFHFLQNKCRDVFIAKRETALSFPKVSKSSPNKFDLESIIPPQIKTKGGFAKIINNQNFPILKNLALFSLHIYKGGIREPHWHPNATELNFVITGTARLTILSPGGKKDTFTLEKNEGSVIPAGYFHHIENIGLDDLHMVVFFNNDMPDDIGISGALSVYSAETLAALFSVDPQFFKTLPHFDKDRMIVIGGA